MDVDEVLAQIETDKVTIDVRYTTGKPGKLTKMLIKEEDTVSVGQEVAVVEEGAEGSTGGGGGNKEVSIGTGAPPACWQQVLIVKEPVGSAQGNGMRRCCILELAAGAAPSVGLAYCPWGQSGASECQSRNPPARLGVVQEARLYNPFKTLSSMQFEQLLCSYLQKATCRRQQRGEPTSTVGPMPQFASSVPPFTACGPAGSKGGEA